MTTPGVRGAAADAATPSYSVPAGPYIRGLTSPTPDWSAPSEAGSESDGSRCTADIVYSARRHASDVRTSRHPAHLASRLRGRGASNPDGRVPFAPYNMRDGIGSFGVYQGNWGGWSKQALARQHFYQDIVIHNPPHILCAQEVEQNLIDVLKHPTARSEHRPEWRPKEHARRREVARWHVAQGDEGPQSTAQDGTCIIAAQDSVAEFVHLLEWVKTRDGPWKEHVGKGADKRTITKMAQSRNLIAQVAWRAPMNGRASTVVATVHMHRKPPKGTNPA